MNQFLRCFGRDVFHVCSLTGRSAEIFSSEVCAKIIILAPPPPGSIIGSFDAELPQLERKPRESRVREIAGN